ncbi:MAG: hypothetical protein P1U58_09600 [Verrucomicrobiales bacterium]|nr:hypothetical protein [Verrucomicrobiales bacterium]
MNNWGYLILIAALVALTAFMLYARFAARSREKSLHHAPADPGLLRFKGEQDTAQVPFEDLEDTTEPVVMDLKPVCQDEDDKKAREKSSKSEDTYFDELQDAAAGLAMLMRSSSARPTSEPVVFEPQEDEIVENDCSLDEVEEKSSSAESFKDEEALRERASDTKGSTNDGGGDSAREDLESNPQHESDREEISSINEAMDNVEALLDGPHVFGETENTLEVEGERHCLINESSRALLGDQVVSQISAIDSGLDELEALVGDVEHQLSLLEDFISAPVEEGVSEAA